jgi:hypothetical protein
MKITFIILLIWASLYQYSFAQEKDTIIPPKVASIEVTLNGQIVHAETICKTLFEQKEPTAEDLKNALMNGDKESQILDVNFTMSDEPITDSLFIFGIETEEAKQLFIKMFDEESFELVIDCQFDIEPGNNYKALNTSALKSGSYIIQLRDAYYKELNRTLVIQDQPTIVNLIDTELMGQHVKATIVCVAQQYTNTEEASADDIIGSLMEAEKETQILDVNFSMQDNPITNGLVIFGIEAEDMKELSVELYDEEGFTAVVDCSFHIEIGSNYSAINVDALDAGEYLLRVKDKEGKELVRTITIKHKED